MIIVSEKLGLITNSSTQSEIVATREQLHKCTLFHCFRCVQDTPAKEDLRMQDIKIGTLLQNNE